MTRLEVRLWGDPFGDGRVARAMRRLLAAATAAGWRCGVSVSPGARRMAVAAGPSAEQEALCRPVAATAPVVVVAAASEVGDAAAMAALEWPDAGLVLPWGLAAADAVEAAEPSRLLATVERHLRGWPGADPDLCLERDRLERYATLPVSAAPGIEPVVLHVGSPDPADGTDVAVRAAVAAGLAELRVLLPRCEPAFEHQLRTLAAVTAAAAGRLAPRLSIAVGELDEAVLTAAAAVLLPYRGLARAAVLLAALASGRPVLTSSPVAARLGSPGICLSIGGRWRPPRNEFEAGAFEPDVAAAAAALGDLTARPERAREGARRARRSVLERHCAGAPAPAMPPALPAGRLPRVVLEAPLLELSSTAVLTLETARALQRRGRVELHLVPVAPFAEELGWLRARAPELLPLLGRPPATADLWLGAGWPPRALPKRRSVGCAAVRLDWEYGALPQELTPLVTEDADLIVVHSRTVERLVRAAGRPAASIVRVPHGVDGSTFCETAPPSDAVRRFAAGRPAVLFVGGLIWRKGFDLLLSALLRLRSVGPPPVLVVKPLGASSSYAGYHLGALLDRVRRQAGAPEVLVLDDELAPPELAGVYTACDLLVHPYRGEGFGMPVLEARACGVPVLVTRGGPTDDFCAGPACLGVDATRRTLDLPGGHLGRPWVLEPDAAALQAALAGAVGALPSLRAAARRAAAEVRAAHSWDNAAAALERIACSARCSPRSRGAIAAPAAAPASADAGRSHVEIR